MSYELNSVLKNSSKLSQRITDIIQIGREIEEFTSNLERTILTTPKEKISDEDLQEMRSAISSVVDTHRGKCYRLKKVAESFSQRIDYLYYIVDKLEKERKKIGG